jgi:hypothetical protein
MADGAGETKIMQAGGRTVDTTLAADASAPWAARKAVVGFAGPADPELAFRLGMLVSEAVSDRVLSHAVADETGRVRIELALFDHVVRGRVSDVGSAGGGADATLALEMRDLEVAMMGALSDSWGAEREADGTAAIWFAIEPGPAPSTDDYRRRFAEALSAAA